MADLRAQPPTASPAPRTLPAGDEPGVSSPTAPAAGLSELPRPAAFSEECDLRLFDARADFDAARRTMLEALAAYARAARPSTIVEEIAATARATRQIATLVGR